MTTETVSPARRGDDGGALGTDLLGSTIGFENSPAKFQAQAGAPPIAREQVCKSCGTSFVRRAHGGGKPQRFCSTACRTAFHANVAQRSPTCANVNDVGASQPPSETKRTSEAPEADGVDFDWSSDDAVVVPAQRAGAVYWNPRGEIVIRQQGELYDDDAFVFFAPGHAVIIAKAILKLASDAAE